MTQSDFEAGPEWLAALAAVQKLPEGQLIADALGLLQKRIVALEQREPGWRTP